MSLIFPELQTLYFEKDVVGGFASNYYWSSSEFTDTIAFAQDFGTSTPPGGGKNAMLGVRAIRAF